MSEYAVEIIREWFLSSQIEKFLSRELKSISRDNGHGFLDMQRLSDDSGEVTGFLVNAERPIDAAGLEALRQRLEALQP